MPRYKSHRSINDTKPAGGMKREIVKIEDFIEPFKFPDNKYVQARLVGPAIPIAMHWIEIKTKEGKQIRIPKPCLRYDAADDKFDSTRECPYCEKLHPDYKAKQQYWNNAIIREIQDDCPTKKFAKNYSKTEHKTGFLDKDSKSWTPIRAMKITPGVSTKLQNLAQLNKHKKKPYPVSDDDYGCDVMIKYDSKAKAATNAYDVQIGKPSPLSELEKSYLHANIELAVDAVSKNIAEDLETARKECKALMSKVVKKADNADAEYSDDGEGKMGKSKTKDKSKKSKREESSEELSSEESMETSSEESGSEESSEEPKKKGKAGKGKKGKKEESSDELSSEESSEEMSSEENSSEESSEEPKKKGKAAKGGKKGKKEESESEESSDELSSDEGSDELSSEESSEEPKKKSAKGGKAAKGKKGRK